MHPLWLGQLLDPGQRLDPSFGKTSYSSAARREMITPILKYVFFFIDPSRLPVAKIRSDQTSLDDELNSKVLEDIMEKV